MKRTLSHLLWILALVLPLTASAQFPEDLNLFGLHPLDGGQFEFYTDHCTWQPQNSVVTVGIFLWYAMNPGSPSEVQHIGGFECTLRPQGTDYGSAVILGRRYPVPAIDVGQYNSLIVGFGEPVPVYWELPTLLAEVDIFFGAPEGGQAVFPADKASPVGCYNYTAELWLEPATPASISGRLAYLDADDTDGDPLVAADPMGWEGQPALMIVPIIVGTVDKSWDGVKALYR